MLFTNSYERETMVRQTYRKINDPTYKQTRRQTGGFTQPHTLALYGIKKEGDRLCLPVIRTDGCMDEKTNVHFYEQTNTKNERYSDK